MNSNYGRYMYSIDDTEPISPASDILPRSPSTFINEDIILNTPCAQNSPGMPTTRLNLTTTEQKLKTLYTRKPSKIDEGTTNQTLTFRIAARNLVIKSGKGISNYKKRMAKTHN